MTDWDWTFDLVVVGSGAAGLTAAVAARHRGLSVVVLEKTELFGGSTALSGGGMWIPNNALMQQANVPDSFAEALIYLQATVGEQTPRLKQETYLREAPRMLDFLIARGLRFRRAEGYADYYPEKPGGNVRSRLVESALFSGRALGKTYPLIRFRSGIGGSLAMTTSEYRAFGLVFRTPRTFLAVAQVIARNVWQVLAKRRDMAMGKALVGQLVFLAEKQGVTLWKNSPMLELVTEQGNVTGIIAQHEGHRVHIRARVLRKDGTPIAGLYAAGNTTASVMGHFYPGPGATIGPAMTFGYIAALDMATTTAVDLFHQNEAALSPQTPGRGDPITNA